MKLYNYRKQDAYFVSIGLAKKLDGINQYSDRREIIEECLKKYLILELEEQPKTNPLWRITLPVYLVFFGTLLILSPIKWLFTGQFHYGNIKWLIRLNVKWAKKLGL